MSNLLKIFDVKKVSINIFAVCGRSLLCNWWGAGSIPALPAGVVLAGAGTKWQPCFVATIQYPQLLERSCVLCPLRSQFKIKAITNKINYYLKKLEYHKKSYLFCCPTVQKRLIID